MKKILFFIVILFLLCGAVAKKPAPKGSGTFAELDGNNEYTGQNNFEQGVCFDNANFPPELGCQFHQFVFSDEWYTRVADDTIGVAWSEGMKDTTKKFLQMSTAGADYANLTAGGDDVFDDYWGDSSTAGTLSRKDNYFVTTNAGNNQTILLYNNDVSDYAFDVTQTPLTFSFVMNWAEVGISGLNVVEGVLFYDKVPLKIFQIQATRTDGVLGVYQVYIHNNKYLTTELEVTSGVDNIITVNINGTAWSAYSSIDGKIGDSTDIRDGGGPSDFMVLGTAFEDWAGAFIGTNVSYGNHVSGTSTLKLGGIAFTPTNRQFTSIESAITLSDLTQSKDGYTVYIDDSGGNVTQNLPDTPISECEYTFSKIAGSNTTTISGNGNTINGAGTKDVALNTSVTVMYNDDEWRVK